MAARVAVQRECRQLTRTLHALQCTALEPLAREELSSAISRRTAGLQATGADFHIRLKLLPMPLIGLHPVKDCGVAPAASCSVQLPEAVLRGGGGAAAAVALPAAVLSSVALPPAAALCWVSCGHETRMRAAHGESQVKRQEHGQKSRLAQQC